MSDGVTVNIKVVYQFEVKARQFTLILNALRKAGGNGEELAAYLESQRSLQSTALVERFKTYSHLEIYNAENGDE